MCSVREFRELAQRKRRESELVFRSNDDGDEDDMYSARAARATPLQDPRSTPRVLQSAIRSICGSQWSVAAIRSFVGLFIQD